MFGQRLKELRLSKGITQKELATIAGVDRTSIGKYESRNVVPNLEVIYLLADYFGVTIDYLLGREPNEDKKNSLPPLNQKDEKDISAALDKILNNLECEEALSFYGEPMDEHTKELIKLSLENSMKMAKQMAKKKFTPKKYR